MIYLWCLTTDTLHSLSATISPYCQLIDAISHQLIDVFFLPTNRGRAYSARPTPSSTRTYLLVCMTHRYMRRLKSIACLAKLPEKNLWVWQHWKLDNFDKAALSFGRLRHRPTIAMWIAIYHVLFSHWFWTTWPLKSTLETLVGVWCPRLIPYKRVTFSYPRHDDM